MKKLILALQADLAEYNALLPVILVKQVSYSAHTMPGRWQSGMHQQFLETLCTDQSWAHVACIN